MEHHLSRPLRNMSGLVNQKLCGEAADELDRLNTLIVDMTTRAADHHIELSRKIKDLNDKLRAARNPDSQ